MLPTQQIRNVDTPIATVINMFVLDDAAPAPTDLEVVRAVEVIPE